MPSTSNTNTSPATPATAHPDIPPFPSPSTFSILPDIWLLLARLNILHHPPQQLQQQQQQQQQQQTTQAQTNGHHQTPQQQQTQHPPPSSSHGHPTSQTAPSSTPSQQSQTLPTQPHSHSHSQQSQSQPPLPSAGSATGPAATAPIFHGAPLLDLKDLPAQIYPLKQRLAKARAAVTGLPDVARTVEEQEAEIHRLERMVKGLRGRLGLLGEMAISGSGSGLDVVGMAAARSEEGVRDVEMKDEPQPGHEDDTRVDAKEEQGVVTERGGTERKEEWGEG
ncbi:hypothetical protein AYL99_01460 [Fonsecaea erecta]|uniref:Mediator of RNA polymerase II transcription subunit 9 n=1 Tax=Fonsecaea erecta TaxID=1367422 RepID=A0A179A061_9EURO|nr:hypothetical protein AYL99_01460 [Fonsecaea erecta]OAP65488.1 hypothetical protein AYL99_01460 [Fonsecaea erecta]